MKDFSQDKVNTILREIDVCLRQVDTPPIAALDADGTLWSCDMGEALFKYQISHNLLPQLPANPWDYYLKMHEISPREAFLWLAQINKDYKLDQIQRWAKESLASFAEFPIFSSVRTIVDHLHQRGAHVYVVTASVKWAVEPAAAIYRIPEDRVIGISTQVVDGIITSVQEGPITWREGKVEGLYLRTGGKRPFFCAGNTQGDLPLLESSTHIKLVIASAQKGEVNFPSERAMVKLAQERNWFYHSFV